MSLAQKTIRGLKWQAVEFAGRQLLGLVVFTTLARLLDPAAFGLVGMVGVYLAFVGMFVDQGIGTALIQRKDLQPDHLHTAFWFNLGCASLMCGGTMALAGPVALLFDEPKLEPLLRWASLGLILGALGNIHTTLFMREMDFKQPAMRMLIAQLAGGIVGVTLALLGHGVWALIAQQLVAALAGTIFLWIASTYRPQRSFSVARLRDLFGMSGTLFTTTCLWFFASRTDQFLIGRVLGANSLGFYVIGAKLPDIIRGAVMNPVGAVALPAFSSIQTERERVANAAHRGMRVVSLVAFPTFLGLAAIGPNLVPVVFGIKWAESVIFLQLFALHSLMLFTRTLYHPLLVSLGLKRDYLFINVINAVLGVSACMIGVQFGAEWVLVGMIVSPNLVGIFTFKVLVRKAGLSWSRFWGPCILPLVSSIVMAALIFEIGRLGSSIRIVALQVVVGVIVFTLIIWLTDRARLMEVISMLRARSNTQPLPA